MPLELVNNGDSGLDARTKINAGLEAINNMDTSGPTLPTPDEIGALAVNGSNHMSGPLNFNSSGSTSIDLFEEGLQVGGTSGRLKLSSNTVNGEGRVEVFRDGASKGFVITTNDTQGFYQTIPGTGVDLDAQFVSGYTEAANCLAASLPPAFVVNGSQAVSVFGSGLDADGGLQFLGDVDNLHYRVMQRYGATTGWHQIATTALMEAQVAELRAEIAELRAMLSA